jgi:RNA polymerase sigma-70 factor, ECF subfamily
LGIGAEHADVDVTPYGNVVNARRNDELQLSPASRVLGLNEHIAVPTPLTEPVRSAEFATFMRAYQDMVFSTATRLLGNDAQAQDIAQEVFIRAYAHFDQLRASTSSGGWLKTVATNLALNHLRRYRQRWWLFSEMSADPDPASPVSPPAELGTQQQRALIEDAIRALPTDQRTALVLYHFEELSYQQIALRLHASLAKIKTDIRRARLALLPLLQSSGIGRSELED